MSTSLIVAAVVALCVVLVLSRMKSPQAPGSAEERASLEHQLRLHLAAGRKIEAIKLYRCLHGTDLKASKAAVETLLVGGSRE